jgi:hypothetical protein
MHFGGSIANLEKNDALTITKNHLRKKSADIALESTSSYIRKKGYYEEAYYLNINADGKCVHPAIKQMYGLNACVASAEANPPAPYAIGSIYADPTGNTYYLYEQWFSDSACTMPVTNTYADYSSFIAICDPAYQELDIVRSEPLNPTTDNLGYSLFIYNTSPNCYTNNYENGVIEASYGKLNDCLQTSNPDDDPTAGDLMFTSCSSTGFVINTYSSTNGTCAGTVETVTLDSTTACLTNDNTINGWALGYLNYGCSTVV